MVIDFGPLGVNFGLEVNFKSLGIVFIHLGVDFGPLGSSRFFLPRAVEFRSLVG